MLLTYSDGPVRPSVGGLYDVHGEGEVEAVAEQDHGLDGVLVREAGDRPGQQLGLQCRLPSPGQTGAELSLHLGSSTIEMQTLLQKLDKRKK